MWRDRSPVTVAGAAEVSHPLPSSARPTRRYARTTHDVACPIGRSIRFAKLTRSQGCGLTTFCELFRQGTPAAVPLVVTLPRCYGRRP